MSDVFISSVVRDFRQFREAAKKGVELLGHRPVMSETFGARPHSSEVACIAEVQASDAYVLILGQAYGYVPEHGDVSVTHAEYRTAKASNRPILVFVQNVDMEPQQRAFKQEVEAYQTGEFRATFSTPEELKDAIVQALSTWQRSNQAISAEQFETLVDDALDHVSDRSRYGYEPRVSFAYLPQPTISVDVAAVESDLDDTFRRLCDAGLASLRDGYDAEGGHEWAGLHSGKLSYAVFEDGLRILIATPMRERESTLGYFMPPDLLRKTAIEFFTFLPTSAGLFSMRLMKMDQTFVAENPGGNSLTMRSFGGEDDYATARFFNPMSRGAFEAWLNTTMNAVQRRYGYPPRSS